MLQPTRLPILLASTSPRRHELLNQVNIPHGRLAVSIDETQRVGELPVAYITRMVQQKALAAANQLTSNHHDCLIITADTIGVLPSGEVLQKPQHLNDAKRMWQQMSDQTHEVWTAVQVSYIVTHNGTPTLKQSKSQTVKTQVQFVALTDAMMEAYWQTGEPADKAGGYAIQGLGAAWVKAINGSYSNVVGLPLVETIELLNTPFDGF